MSVMDEIDKQVGPWTVEWCSTGDQRGTFHIDTLNRTVERNTRQFLNIGKARQAGAWIIVGVFPTGKEASEFCRKLRDAQDERGWV